MLYCRFSHIVLFILYCLTISSYAAADERVSTVNSQLLTYSMPLSEYKNTLVVAALMDESLLYEKSNQWIELKNTSDAAINLRDWILQDEFGSHVISENTIVPAHGTIVFSQKLPIPLLRLKPDLYYIYSDGITLTKNNRQLWLLDNNAKLVLLIKHEYSYAVINKHSS